MTSKPTGVFELGGGLAFHSMKKSAPSEIAAPAEPRQAAEGSTLLAASTELMIRTFLWQGHGHEGIYGDDGEMQCCQCHCDYKRDPLDEVIEKARVAALEEGLKRLAEPATPKPPEGGVK